MDGDPRISQVASYGDHHFIIVDDELIRDSSLKFQEFGLFATCLDFPTLIPKHEVWISLSINRVEFDAFKVNALAQLRAVKSIVNFGDVYNIGLKAERAFRSKRINKDEVLYHRHYCSIDYSSLDVWLVNGKFVRDHFKIDFVEGGHDIVYDFVPGGEIWVESGLSESEIPVIILHEYVERQLMLKQDLPYHEAHSIAANVEFRWRHRLGRGDVIRLRSDLVFELVGSSELQVK